MAVGRMDIAIVGTACRLPGGIRAPEGLWKRLRAGDDLVTEIPAHRWNTDLYRHPRSGEPSRSYTFSAGVIDHPEHFDAGFFGVSPREAEQMDPQQRVILETAFEAIESAGWALDRVARSNCAVYVGVSGTEYANLRLSDPATGDAHFMTGNTLSIVANRLSYVFDLAGPSMAVDTACSSAVAAMYEACAGLAEGRFDTALVGAVSLLLSPYPFLGFSRASMLSDYGQSRAFAEGAAGYVRGEGAGVLALKPLAKALADGDPVRAVIRCVDLNQDGRTNGIALPNVVAQGGLLGRIYPAAGVDPGDVDYFEAHGTGTAVGDPTEAGAIGQALGQLRPKDDPLLIGSIKTNIGHLEPAAGMAGVLKAMLTLEHGEIPPSLHADVLNPIIPFDDLNLRVARELTPLKRRAGSGIVGVNSFGFGGLNGHVIVEGPPRRAARRRSLTPANDGAPEPAPWPIALSARHRDALAARAGDLADLLEADPSLPLRDIAYTLWRRRTHMDQRLVLRAEDRAALTARLRQVAAGDFQAEGAVMGATLAGAPRTAFVFSGNGAQWAGMGQTLLKEDPAFAAAVRRASEAVAAYAGWSPLDLLAGPADAIEIDRTEIAQPLLFTLQAGLIEAFAARGVAPDAVLGHSVGEVAAAFAAGALDLDQAARVIVRRSEAQAMTRGQGRMAAVSLDAGAAGARIQRTGGRIELAAINSPAAVTLAGPEAALQEFVDGLVAEDIDARMLDLDYAFHSRAMEPARAPLAASLSGLAPRQGDRTFFSAVEGAALAGEALDADYWWRNIRQPVRFAQAAAALLESEPGAAWTLVEIGPHPILQAYLRQTAREGAVQARPLGSMARKADDAARLDRVADEAFCLGALRNPDAVAPERGEVADLPAYPWRHAPYWFKPTEEREGLFTARRDGALLGFRSREDVDTWDAQIDAAIFPTLADHRVGEAAVFPAAGYVAALLEAAAAIAPDAEAVAIEEFEIRRPLVLDAERSTMARVAVAENGRADFLAKPRLMEAPFALHARGRIVRGAQTPAGVDPGLGVEADVVEPDALYAFAKSMGLDYGPAFRPVEALSIDGDAALAALAPAPPPARGGHRVVAPEHLDGAMQTLIALLMRQAPLVAGEAMLPVAASRIAARRESVPVAASARLKRAGARIAVADLTLFDEAGDVVLAAENVRFQRVALAEARPAAEQVYAWRSTPLRDAAPYPVKGLAATARAAAKAAPDPTATARRLNRLAKASADWRAFWEAAPDWSAEAALVGCLHAGAAPDKSRIEQMLAGGPAFAPLRAALDAAVARIVAALPDGRRARVLELAAPGFDLAAGTGAAVEDGRLDWRRADLSQETLAAEDRFDLILAPFALAPAAAESAVAALAPGGRLLASAPKPAPWLDAIWNAAYGEAAANASSWREAFKDMKAAAVDCGTATLWLTESPARPSEAPAPTLAGAWRVAHLPDQAIQARALAKAVRTAGATVTLAPLEPDAAPEDLASDLAGVETLLILAAASEAAPAETATTLAAPALAAARAAAEGDAPRLVGLALDDGPEAAALLATLRVLGAETPALAPIALEAPSTKPAGRWAAKAVAALGEIFETDEAEAAVAPSGGLAGLRLKRTPLADVDPHGLGFKPGALESVSWRAAPPAMPLAANAIEVQVKAAGVNFRDVMFGLGILPEEAVEAGFAGATVGMEAAGVVTAVGAGVDGFKPGDRVVCVASGCFRDRVTTLASAAAPIPDGQTFEAAATLPIVALTAYYSLKTLAALGPDDTVLIHGAAGGVGLTALQYAQHVGARVIATAGTEEKRAILAALGVEMIADSRSLSFVDDVKRWTDGEGVDVALNSLAGEAMAATLGLMRPFGRFIELGKRDFFENTEVGLKRLRENVSYFAVDADQLLAAKPALAGALFREVGGLIEAGVFKPLPYRAFPADDLPGALKWMQRARHIGKVIVSAPARETTPARPLPVRGDGTYVIAGGLEGFGLETARRLAARGAGRLVLASRRGPNAPGADAALAGLRALGADAKAIALDITDRDAVAKALAKAGTKRKPLRGVVHAAARYADGLAVDMTADQFKRAVAVKADGAAALAAAAAGRDLDFLLLYSSATVALGNPGQANYVAGNAAVESVARQARRDGIPAMAVAWGPIADTGALARQANVADHLERQLGRPPMPSSAALDLLDGLWASGAVAPIVLDIDWRALPARAAAAARFAWTAPKRDDAGGEAFRDLVAGLDEADARDVVAEMIADRVAAVLGMTADQVDVARPVADLGLDSLMAMELKLSLEEEIGAELPTMLLAEGASVSRIAEKVTTQLRAGAGLRDDKARSTVDETLRRHAENLDPDAVEDAISSFRDDGERRRLLS